MQKLRKQKMKHKRVQKAKSWFPEKNNKMINQR